MFVHFFVVFCIWFVRLNDFWDDFVQPKSLSAIFQSPEDDLPESGRFRLTTIRNRQAPVSHLTASTNRGRWLTGAWPVPAYDKPELGRMWWQIFKLTYRIPDRPRLVGIVYVFLTGASMRIVQLDTRIPGIPVSLCTNKTRTSVLDIMISVFQLTIGLNTSQVILACSVPVYQIHKIIKRKNGKQR